MYEQYEHAEFDEYETIILLHNKYKIVIIPNVNLSDKWSVSLTKYLCVQSD